jgi:hypothetical protein
MPQRKGGAACSIVTSGGIAFSVQRFEDLLNKTWNDLIGKDTTEDMLTKILRTRSDHITGVQERPVTASDVEKMLESKQQQQKEQGQK